MSKPPDDTPPDEDDRVGYGRPPLATRFRPGVSGNPRGRPKGSRSLAAVVAATLGERITVIENGRPKRITKLEAVVKQLFKLAASGEARSMQLLLRLVQESETITHFGPDGAPIRVKSLTDTQIDELLARLTK